MAITGGYGYGTPASYVDDNPLLASLRGQPLPQIPQSNGGMLGGVFSDDPGASAQGGLLSGYGPLAGNQKAAVLFANLRDAVSGFSGGPPTNYGAQQGQQFAQQNALAERDALRKKIQAAHDSGDPVAFKSAVLEAATADHELASSIMKAAEFGNPKIQDIGGSGYSIDPLGNKAPQLVVPSNKAPTIDHYQQGDQVISREWDPVNRVWKTLGSGTKYKPTVAKPTGVAGFGNPASLFGGR